MDYDQIKDKIQDVCSKVDGKMNASEIVESVKRVWMGGPLVGCRLKFSNFVGSRLKFSIFVGSRLNFSIFVGCRKISVNK